MSSLRQVIDHKILRIIDLVLKHPEQIYNLQKISTDAKVPLGTTHRIVAKLVKAEFLTVISVGKVKLYRLNKARKRDFEVVLK